MCKYKYIHIHIHWHIHIQCTYACDTDGCKNDLLILCPLHKSRTPLFSFWNAIVSLYSSFYVHRNVSLTIWVYKSPWLIFPKCFVTLKFMFLTMMCVWVRVCVCVYYLYCVCSCGSVCVYIYVCIYVYRKCVRFLWIYSRTYSWKSFCFWKIDQLSVPTFKNIWKCITTNCNEVLECVY